MSYINLRLTQRQFEALLDCGDILEGMMGEGSDFSEVVDKNLTFLNKMLVKNGFEKRYLK